jgi:outer membrane protein
MIHAGKKAPPTSKIGSHPVRGRMAAVRSGRRIHWRVRDVGLEIRGTMKSIDFQSMNALIRPDQYSRRVLSGLCPLSATCFLTLLGGCSGDQLFPELDPDAFVSSQASEAWTPTEGIDYEPHAVRPLGSEEALTGLPEGRSSLMSLVALALETNPETRSSWENARVKAAEYGSVRSFWYPTFAIGASLSTSRAIYPAGVSGNIADVMDAEFSGVYPSAELSYVLLDFGRRSSADAEARQILWIANLEFNRKIQTTVFEVQRTYFELDTSLGLYNASLSELELALTVVDAVEDRMAVGLATAPELLFARQELAQAEYDVQSRISGIDDARSALLVAIGLPATTPIEIEPLSDVPLPGNLDFEVQQAINTALQERPDLAAAVAGVRAAEAAVDFAKSDFYPTVDFQGGVGWEQFYLNVRVNNQNWESQDYGGINYSVGLTGNWILFEGFELRNNLRRARAARRKAQADLEALRIKAIGEVWDSYSDYLAAQRQYEFGVALVESSRESYDAMLASYDVGLATITELVASERSLAASLAELVKTRGLLLTSSAEVSYAIGSGDGSSPEARAGAR